MKLRTRIELRMWLIYVGFVTIVFALTMLFAPIIVPLLSSK